MEMGSKCRQRANVKVACGVSPVEDSTQATQDRGVPDPCAQKIVRKPGTGFDEKFTSYIG
jgi:hypothetical protein